MTRLWRWTGYIMIAIGVLHTTIFLAAGHSEVAAMVRDGLVSTVGTDRSRMAVWYGGALLGVCMVLIGVAVQSLIRQTGRPAPVGLGWALAAVGAVGALLDPVSGAWLVLACGLLMALPPRAVRSAT